jgi:WD40 repeat protein
LGNESHKSQKKGDEEKGKITDSKPKYFFTQSIFVKISDMVITATTDGKIIVWDRCEALCKENENKNDRRKIKEVQLLNNNNNPNSIRARINFILNYDKYIVIGSGDGGVKFYDDKFIINRWFDNVGWTITSISFDFEEEPDETQNDEEMNKEKDSSNRFKCLPFIISDVSAAIKRVSKAITNERDRYLGISKVTYIDNEDSNIRYEEIYRGIESKISAVALHPRDNICVIGTYNKGQHKDLKQKEVKSKEPIIKEKRFEYRSYIQTFFYPDHMRAIKEQIEKEDEWYKQKLLNKKPGEDLKKYEEDKYINPYKRYFDAVPTAMEFSPNGKVLVVGTSDDKIYILDPYNLHNSHSGVRIKNLH